MIPLYKPYMPNELPEINNILYSGQLSYGKYGKTFESMLESYVGCNSIVSVSSYSAALLVAYTTIGLKPNDEIIASPMSCLASNQPATALGAKIIWADIDPATGTLNPDEVKRKVNKNTKAIFHNHHCGYLGYIDEINLIAKENGIIVIDDAIEGFGSEYKGNILGNNGSDITVFSFQTVRLPNTLDGGAIAFRDRELFNKAELVRDLGVDREQFRDKKGEINKGHDVITTGFGFTPNELNSYIGCSQLADISELLELQKKNAFAWREKLRVIDKGIQFIFQDEKFQKPNYWIFGILSNQKVDLIEKFRKLGFYSSSVHLPNNYYSIFNNFEELPGVNDFYNRFLAIPCGWWVKEELIESIKW